MQRGRGHVVEGGDAAVTAAADTGAKRGLVRKSWLCSWEKTKGKLMKSVEAGGVEGRTLGVPESRPRERIFAVCSERDAH